MKNKKSVLITILISLFFTFLSAYAQNIKQQIHSLENDFKDFKYDLVIKKGRFLLGDPYTTKNDSLQIYQFMLSSAYALGDMTQAEQIIKEILSCQPSHSLNPKTTSPKIIELFNSIKRDTETVIQNPADNLDKPEKIKPEIKIVKNAVPPAYTISNVILPGSGQIMTGQKSKGYFHLAASAVLLGGSIYFSIQTSAYHNDYMKAKGDVNYNELYDLYNTSYKWRNTFFIGYGIWSLYSLFDLHNSVSKNLSFSGGKDNINLNYSFYLK